MSTVTLGSGIPFKAALIPTEPVQIRFVQIADQAYTIRINYVPVPTAITSGTQTLYLQEEFHDGLYLKFVEKIALSLGDIGLSTQFKLLYNEWLRENKHVARREHLKVNRLNFSWL